MYAPPYPALNYHITNIKAKIMCFSVQEAKVKLRFTKCCWVHASYSEGRNWEDRFEVSLGEKIARYSSQPTSWMWWCTPPISPAIQEAYLGGLQFKASLGKLGRPYLKNN
jgi:hypothetical protein